MKLKSEFEVPCPCCASMLVIDANLRRVIRHVEPERSDKPKLDEAHKLLEEAKALPQLVRHDDLDWHIHATDLDAPLARRILVEAAMAVVDVIRSDQMDRLAMCDADDCESLYVDLSKNASRRFCSTRCGNRMAVRAYRARAV